MLATVGSIYIYGWKMDIFESVCITILVGFSIDYTVHLGIAYVEHGEAAGRIADRRAATQRAVSHLGVSVTAGANPNPHPHPHPHPHPNPKPQP